MFFLTETLLKQSKQSFLLSVTQAFKTHFIQAIYFTSTKLISEIMSIHPCCQVTVTVPGLSSDHSTSLEAVIVALTRVERRCDVSVAGLVQMRGRFLKESLKIEWESRLVEIIARRWERNDFIFKHVTLL